MKDLIGRLRGKIGKKFFRNLNERGYAFLPEPEKENKKLEERRTLTPHEEKVLNLLNAGGMVTHFTFQENGLDRDIIKVLISRLRKKRPDVTIEAVRGKGYQIPIEQESHIAPNP